ncbi:MAG: sensor histidine kinase [Caloramator sp.]|nr:sensor histidine kinase [Caloramator sp.]
MKFKEFLYDKIYTFIFYFVTMLFISLVFFLDGTLQVNISNILYINAVCFVFFLIYLLWEYFLINKHYSLIKDIIYNEKEDIIHRLPKPNTNVQYIYNELLKKIYEEQMLKIENLYNLKKENQEFITSWVHEIKTPISVCRLIIENSIENPSEDILYSIEEEINKIDNYVEQALYYSKSDDFSKDYFIKEISLLSILKEIIKKHSKTFISKGISVELPDNSMEVLTDKKWLIFIINQIISNSLKYTPKGGKIKIFLEKNEKEKRLIIIDNGIGIKNEDIGRVFDRGFTGHNGRENYKSTGMGLYLAKKLCEKLGHKISIESKYGEYTKVTIHFPKLNDYYNTIK